MKAIALVLLTATAHADEPPQPTPFDRGKFGLSGGAGRQSTFDTSYIVVGLGAGYYVLDGVEVGLAASHYFGDGPSISRVTPSLRYVAQPLFGRSPLIPYVGAFYDHYFVGGTYGDVDGIGGRAGVIFVSGQLLLGLGIGVEKYVTNCAKDCVQVFPDVSIGVSL